MSRGRAAWRTTRERVRQSWRLRIDLVPLVERTRFYVDLQGFVRALAPSSRAPLGGACARILTLLVLLLLSAPAGASGPRVQVLAPPEPPRPPPTAPVIEPPDPVLLSHLGERIVAVDVRADEGAATDLQLPTLKSVRVGDPFEPAAARRAIEEVMATGQFAGARVVVSPQRGGLRLVIRVSPRKLVEELRIDVHGADIERDEVVRAADVTDSGEIVPRDLPTRKKEIEALFERRGYPRSEATISTRTTDDPRRVIVLVDVVPGVPRLIDRRVIYLSDVDDRALRRLTDDYAVKSHERADENKLDEADERLKSRLRSSAYHRAEVSHDVVLDGGLVTLRVRVDAGPRIEPRFEGNEHFDESALVGALDLEEESDRTAAHLAEKLEEFYQRRGFLDARIVAELRGGPEHRVHHLVFKIRENERVAVALREYPCLKEDEVRHLHEGGPASASAIGNEIDSFLQEELPGADLFRSPNPKSVDLVIASSTSQLPEGTRKTPIDLDPDTTFVADTYERAALHVQELYRNEGYLSAQVGPVQVVRRRCDPRSPANRCIPVSLPPISDRCTYDSRGIPLPVPPLPSELTCVPDASRGLQCESALRVRIPVKLGPRTTLYDVAFQGLRSYSEQAVARAARVALGEPANTIKLDDARRRIADFYKEEGFAFVDVKYTIEPSTDHTRALVRFEVKEGERVIVSDILIRGNRNTHEWTIRKRIALQVGKPYRASEVRRTQERIATLNVFSSVDVGLLDPHVPEKRKVVMITVVEPDSQYLDLQGGVLSGEGIQLSFEYGQKNFGGDAIALGFRLQLSYLPTPLILDPQVRENFATLGEPGFDKRTGARGTISVSLPEIGLGPLWRAGLDIVGVHDLQRDFFLTKGAVVPGLTFRPLPELVFSLSQSFEYNYVRIFQAARITDYLQSLSESGAVNPDLAKVLLVPDDASFAAAQRFLVTWDRRDNSFNATRGTFFVSGLEHVDWFPVDAPQDPKIPRFEGHFLRFTETFTGYVPLPLRGWRIAATLRLGTNVQLTPASQTYPDRLFFMGGVDSMRGYNLNSFLPQDDADRIDADQGKPSDDPTKFTAAQSVVRGGNLMVNPRVELRIPLRNPFETVLFADVGNLWRRASYPFDRGEFPMRVSAGSGLRFQTPVGLAVAIDYGVNMTRRPDEDFGSFHFAVGVF